MKSCALFLKFSLAILELKKLATDTVGVNNHIFDMELISLLRLYQNLDEEINLLENEIKVLIEALIHTL